MTPQDLMSRTATPFSAPAWPPGPFVSYGVEVLDIHYRSDPEALRRLVPEPLRVREDKVRFQIMRMPDTTGLGDHAAASQAVAVELDGETGYYLESMYLDSLPALAVGRETAGFPKKLGAPSLYNDVDTLVGTLDYGSVRIALATMGYKHAPLNPDTARAELRAPLFMVKMSREPDGTLTACRLVRMAFEQFTVTGAWSGPARLHLVPHALAPIADLPVTEMIGADHIACTDLRYGAPAVVHDYLP
ncbi:acetoacetate decarboxylase [Streptomyces luteireticuli]|uniref:Acetoacetate decarboxylase n=1 Tax=Streptomyces luteireticuli TaxID=173858 RepID=A0ABN0YEZ2_9ACTN